MLQKYLSTLCLLIKILFTRNFILKKNLRFQKARSYPILEAVNVAKVFKYIMFAYKKFVHKENIYMWLF
jgi:hypothetical protein